MKNKKYILMTTIGIILIIILIVFIPKKEKDNIKIDNNIPNDTPEVTETVKEDVEETEVTDNLEVFDENYDKYAEKILKTEEVLNLADIIKKAYGSSYNSTTMKEMKSDDVEFNMGVNSTLYDEMYGETSTDNNLDMLYIFKVSDENKDALVKSLLSYQQNLIDNAMLQDASKEYLTKLSYTKLTVLNGYCFYYCLGSYKTTISDIEEKQIYYELQSNIGLEAIIDFFETKSN